MIGFIWFSCGKYVFAALLVTISRKTSQALCNPYADAHIKPLSADRIHGVALDQFRRKLPDFPYLKSRVPGAGEQILYGGPSNHALVSSLG